MKPERARELTVVLIHLAFWSQLGVLTRIYLDRFFSDGCRGTWGLCLTSDGIALSTSHRYSQTGTTACSQAHRSLQGIGELYQKVQN